MLQTTLVADPVTSENSASPSPQIPMDTIESSKDDASLQQQTQNTTLSNSATQRRSSSPDPTNPHTYPEDDASLHAMVQSILDDSDNDVVLSNLKGLGYNNIQYNTIHENDNTASSIYDRSAPHLDNPKPNSNEQHVASQSAPSLHNTAVLNNKSDPLTLPPNVTKRKYVLEWRTVVFIRHGKSKWNAAESNAIGKVVAAGQGLWEYYKHKKLRQNNIKKNKSEVDIMDAPLSREGIMEALNLCGYLREYETNIQLTSYNELFESTRNDIDDVIKTIDSIDDIHEIRDKLQVLVKLLDEYKNTSLIAAHPPQDDDNMRLPQPVPEITRHAQINPNSQDLGLQDENVKDSDHKLDGIDENNNIEDTMTIYSRSPSTNPVHPDEVNTDANNETKRKDTFESDVPFIPSTPPKLSPAMSTQEIPNGYTQNENEKPKNEVITKGTKRYMAQIADPHSPMTAQYIINILKGDEDKAGVVVSNLRRAMSTACICLKDRLQKRPYEKIQILGCLQEIGLNSDTRPLLFTKERQPILSKTEKTSPLLKGYNMKQLYAQRLSTKYYKGDASDKTAQQRLQEFALWLFAQRKYLHVVVIGHSHWFRSFFKAYLPEKIEEDELPAKVRTAKIRNCGVVAFRIQKKYVPSKSKRHGRHISFEIAADSITTLQFSEDNKATTNHEQRAEIERERAVSGLAPKDKNDGVLSESDEDEKDKLEEEAALSGCTSPVLAQSVSAVGTQDPGILASIQDGQNQNNDDFLNVIDKDDVNCNHYNRTDRPPIPDIKPPPVPPTDTDTDATTIVSNVEQKQEEDVEEDKEIKDGKTKNFAISLKKPRNWMTRAINKFGGGDKTPTKSDNEREDKKKNEKEKDKDNEKDKDKDTDKDKEKDKHKDKDNEKDKDKEKDKHTEKHKDKEKDKHTEKDNDDHDNNNNTKELPKMTWDLANVDNDKNVTEGEEIEEYA